jgi:hypothetical protein
MFEVKLKKGSDTVSALTCVVGDLLPTIATLLQLYEAENGAYEYQRNYAVTWRRVRE